MLKNNLLFFYSNIQNVLNEYFHDRGFDLNGLLDKLCSIEEECHRVQGPFKCRVVDDQGSKLDWFKLYFLCVVLKFDKCKNREPTLFNSLYKEYGSLCGSKIWVLKLLSDRGKTLHLNFSVYSTYNFEFNYRLQVKEVIDQNNKWIFYIKKLRSISYHN